jgi:hypothetical protein
MRNDSNRSVFLMVLMLSVFLQVIFIYTDTRDTPDRAAVEFAVMYYQLDEAMTSRLCDELAQDEEKNIVPAYIQNMSALARDRGFDVGYMKQSLFNVKTYTLKSTAGAADIRITADMKKGINPLFALMGKLFCIGKTTSLDKTVHVVKEGDKWKVCEGFFSVSES